MRVKVPDEATAEAVVAAAVDLGPTIVRPDSIPALTTLRILGAAWVLFPPSEDSLCVVVRLPCR